MSGAASTGKQIAGVLLVLVSALTFAFATTLAKIAVEAGALVPQVTWLRFATGFTAATIMIAFDRQKLRPKAPLWVGIRAVSNTAVVFLLFYSVQYTTVTKANLLNLTFPVFVFLFAPAITGERATVFQGIALLLTLTGAVLVVRPFGPDALSRFALGDGLALLSAITAGFAIAALRRARRTDDTKTIMFYLMLVGLIANTIMLIGTEYPGSRALGIAATAGICGAAGQFAFTAALRSISAATGAVVSTARILFAATLGMIFFSEQIDRFIVAGAVLILFSIILISVRVSAPAEKPIPISRSG